MRSIIAGLMLVTPVSFAEADEIGNELRNADHALNSSFKEVEKRLASDTGAKNRLVHAQQAWIAFRDAECVFRSGGEDGGSVAPTVVAACKTVLTKERTQQLERYLSCEEGDLSCPVPAN
ncbi:MAG: DUF1311 domain-containing protein [Rhizobiaceae bacterium]|nr:DUF1311 domain-containing protein [Rhizobiaceae bacterium]